MGNQKKPDQVKKGKNIFMLGVIFQVVSYGFFVLLVWTAHRRINSRTGAKGASWKPYLRALYFSSFFIIVRSTSLLVTLWALGELTIPLISRYDACIELLKVA